jgi:hypothetical protein
MWPEPILMTVYAGRNLVTGVDRLVQPIGCGAGEIDCLECGGSGVWDFMEPEIAAADCVQCKGTGRQLIAI